MIATKTAPRAASGTLAPAALLAALGLVLVMLAGHVQADALHAAAHDVRHATGFPCH